MRESDLWPPVREWLAVQGYVVHVEIFEADIVAVKDGRLAVVELKRGLTKGLFDQLLARVRWADEIMAAIPICPEARRLGAFRHYGFGLLCVQNGVVRQRLQPRPQPWSWHKAKAYRMKKLAARLPVMLHEVAGLPSCPELRAQRLGRNGNWPQ